MRAIEGLFRRSDDRKITKLRSPRLTELQICCKIRVLTAEFSCLASALDHVVASNFENLSPKDQKLVNKLPLEQIELPRHKETTVIMLPREKEEADPVVVVLEGREDEDDWKTRVLKFLLWVVFEMLKQWIEEDFVPACSKWLRGECGPELCPGGDSK